MQIDKSAIKIIFDEIIVENPTICRMAENLDVLNADVADVKLQGRTNAQAINELFLEQRRQGVMLEDMRSDIKKMLEIVAPSKIREEQFDQMELKVDQHDHRIAALEDAVQEHLGEHDG